MPPRNSPGRRLLIPAWLAVAAWLALGVPPSRATTAPVSYEVETNAGYVGDSEFTRGSNRVGDIAQFDTRAHFVLSMPIRDEFLVRLGVDWEGYFFSRTAGTPLPESLEGLRLIIGGDWQVGQSWLVRFEAQPGFYSSGNNFGRASAKVPLVLGASYIVSADLQLVAGIDFDPDRKYPVLPGVGARWKFAENWVLNGILPTPRLEFSPAKALTLHLGADLRAETFRVARDFGRNRGFASLDGAVLDYWELRAGAGASWKVARIGTFEVEAGCVPFHDFGFHRAHIDFTAEDVGPYVSIGFKGGF